MMTFLILTIRLIMFIMTTSSWWASWVALIFFNSFNIKNNNEIIIIDIVNQASLSDIQNNLHNIRNIYLFKEALNSSPDSLLQKLEVANFLLKKGAISGNYGWDGIEYKNEDGLKSRINYFFYMDKVLYPININPQYIQLYQFIK